MRGAYSRRVAEDLVSGKGEGAETVLLLSNSQWRIRMCSIGETGNFNEHMFLPCLLNDVFEKC